MSSEAEASAAANSTNVEELKPVVELKNSAGRVSGKGWKMERMATRRTQMPDSLKTPWQERMEKTKREKAIKKLQQELKEEKQADITRRKEITAARKKAALERQQFEEMKAKMSAKKAARLKRKAGRSKKVNG